MADPIQLVNQTHFKNGFKVTKCLRRILISVKIFLSLLGLIALVACDQVPQDGSPDYATMSEGAICALSDEHVEACLGERAHLMLLDECTKQDAEMLLETPCAVLVEAANTEFDNKADGLTGDVSLQCKWFGIGCPVDDSCFPTLSDESVRELLYLSDPNTLIDEYDARDRIEAIATIFEREPDPIGMFSIVYRHITNNAVYSAEEEMYEHNDWTRDLITAFAKRYLENLHGYLTGGPVTAQWKKYYKLARNCKVGRGRVVAVAIATHLLVDLTYALYDVDSVKVHEDDFMIFGEISLWVFPDLVADLKTVYNTDVSDLLNGFFFGKWIDSMKGSGTATCRSQRAARRACRGSQ